MADDTQGLPADTDRIGSIPAGQGEDAAQHSAGREVTSPAVTVPSPPAPHNGAASNGEAPSDGRTAIPLPPDAPRAGPAIGQPVDGLALWDAEGGGDQAAALTTVRIDQNERLVIPFTISMLRVDLHYSDFAALQGYVRCNGPDCLLCRVGRQRDVRDLLPVYDVVDRDVAVLSISPSLRPHALRPQLAPALRRLAGGAGPLLITLRKDGNAKFLVAAQPLPEGADDGAVAIRAFRERFDAGLVDLASPFQQLANEDLATIDEVKALMAAKGIAL